MVGTWKLADIEACNLPQNLATGFSELFGNMLGARYTPVLYCGNQLVNGTNYMLICKQTLAVQNDEEHLVKVVLHQAIGDGINGAWTIVSIERVC